MQKPWQFTTTRAVRALPDRDRPMTIGGTHFVLRTSMVPPFPDGTERAIFGMGCFWGAEREFWIAEGVFTTAVGYAGGGTAHPSYEDVCSGRTGHAEVVLVVYDPTVVSYTTLLKRFWEAHDPTQGDRQGPDRGTQYRSAIYTTTEEQSTLASASRDAFSADLAAAGFGAITTEIAPAGPFFYAEDYHQQYHAKNLARAGFDVRAFYLGDVAPPRHPIAAEGYCGMEPTGVACPIGLGIESREAE